MVKNFLISLFLVCFLSSSAFAFKNNISKGKWWRDSGIAKELSISDEEKEALDDLFFNSKHKRIDLKGKFEKAKLELEQLMTSKTIDEKKAMDQFKKMNAAKNDLDAEKFSFLLQVRDVLGVERFQQLTALQNEKHGKNKKKKGK